MTIKYSIAFYEQYKKANVRIRNRFDQQLENFRKNPNDPQLNNHELKDDYEDYRSIDVTSDWRAIYEEIEEGRKLTIYFVLLGTHKELYG